MYSSQAKFCIVLVNSNTCLIDETKSSIHSYPKQISAIGKIGNVSVYPRYIPFPWFKYS